MKDTGANPTVFTVSKLGNWYGVKDDKTNFPTLTIDAVRDLVLNLFWQWDSTASDDSWSPFRFGYHVWKMNQVLGDDVLNKTLFKSYGINPTAWASRYTRTWAIAYAESSVIICQQMLVQNLQADVQEYKDLVKSANEKLKILDDPKRAWDGYIWPIGK